MLPYKPLSPKRRGEAGGTFLLYCTEGSIPFSTWNVNRNLREPGEKEIRPENQQKAVDSGGFAGFFTGIVLYHRKDGKRVPRGLASALAALQDQAVGDHGDKFRVGGLSLGVTDGEAEVFFAGCPGRPGPRPPRWHGGWHAPPGRRWCRISGRPRDTGPWSRR